MLSFIKLLFKKKNKIQINIMKDFVEGRISTEEFWNILKNDKIIRKILRSNKKLNSFRVYFDENNIEKIDISKLSVRIAIYWKVKQYLKINNYKVIPFNDEEERFLFLSDIQPAPPSLSKEKSKQWCKSRIKELFKYDKKPPEWVQEPEWPIVNGQPLVFKNQKVDGSKFSYYFYDSNTQEEIEIIQYE
jgi:23S rRNA G2069 N7-methylase RlmK/C1962 C5-methylase RlmI